MAEYIEREAVIAILSQMAAVIAKLSQMANVTSHDYSAGISVAIDAIEIFLAADVVPVVRCKDCRYAYDSVGGWCCSHGICVDCVVREDFFCADGKQMDGDGDGV